MPLMQNPSSKNWIRENAFTISRSGGESIRTHDWRFTQWGYGTKGEELYDLKNDPGEFTNLAKQPQFSAKAQELKKLLETRRLQAGYNPKKYRLKK